MLKCAGVDLVHELIEDDFDAIALLSQPAAQIAVVSHISFSLFDRQAIAAPLGETDAHGDVGRGAVGDLRMLPSPFPPLVEAGCSPARGG